MTPHAAPPSAPARPMTPSPHPQHGRPPRMTSTQRPRIRLAAALTAALVGLTTAGCGSDEPQQVSFEELFADKTMPGRSEEHTAELQSLMRRSYSVFCLKKKTNTYIN